MRVHGAVLEPRRSCWVQRLQLLSMADEPRKGMRVRSYMRWTRTLQPLPGSCLLNVASICPR